MLSPLTLLLNVHGFLPHGEAYNWNYWIIAIGITVDAGNAVLLLVNVYILFHMAQVTSGIVPDLHRWVAIMYAIAMFLFAGWRVIHTLNIWIAEYWLEELWGLVTLFFAALATYWLYRAAKDFKLYVKIVNKVNVQEMYDPRNSSSR